jgi:hypothetical protein
MTNLERNARTLRGLLWYQRLKNGSFLSWTVAVWLASIFILCLFNNSGFIIAFGVLYGAAAGLRFGGMETIEGSSEFVFALPPTRQQRCLVSLTLGLTGVIGLTLLGDLALTFNLPQALWRMFFSSGFTEPYIQTNSAFLHWHAVLIPTAVFAATYATASFAKTRFIAIAAPLAGMVVVGAIVGLSRSLEYLLRQGANGIVAIPLLFAFSVLALFLAYRFYLVKEQINQPSQRLRWLAIVIAVVIVLLMLLALLSGIPLYEN